MSLLPLRSQVSDWNILMCRRSKLTGAADDQGNGKPGPVWEHEDEMYETSDGKHSHER